MRWVKSFLLAMGVTTAAVTLFGAVLYVFIWVQDVYGMRYGALMLWGIVLAVIVSMATYSVYFHTDMFKGKGD